MGDLHVVKISTDNLKVAAANVTNAPASLTAAQLVDLYKCNTVNWNTIGGTAGTPIPQIPQTGSGTRNSFLADLQTANGGVAVPLGACVQSVEENDPASITGSTSAGINAIAPFSEGRNNLYDSGYFFDPAVVFPGAATPLTSGVKMLGGYVNNRGLFIAFRDADKNSVIKWQPGSTQNFVQALFLNPGGATLPSAATRRPLLRLAEVRPCTRTAVPARACSPAPDRPPNNVQLIRLAA